MDEHGRLVDDPPVRAGWYRVVWVCDLPKAEAPTASDAAESALAEQMDAGTHAANPFYVIDGDTGAVSEHDLAR